MDIPLVDEWIRVEWGIDEDEEGRVGEGVELVVGRYCTRWKGGSVWMDSLETLLGSKGTHCARPYALTTTTTLTSQSCIPTTQTSHTTILIRIQQGLSFHSLKTFRTIALATNLLQFYQQIIICIRKSILIIFIFYFIVSKCVSAMIMYLIFNYIYSSK